MGVGNQQSICGAGAAWAGSLQSLDPRGCSLGAWVPRLSQCPREPPLPVSTGWCLSMDTQDSAQCRCCSQLPGV